MHEVGHTLGLRHNFRASTVYTRGAARRTASSRAKHGIAGLGDGVQRRRTSRSRARSRASTRCPRSAPTTTGRSSTATARSRREQEAAELRQHRGAQRASRGSPIRRTRTSRTSRVDPAVNQLDLGSDPLAYATNAPRTRARAVAAHRAVLELKPGDSYSVLRRNFTRGLNEARTRRRVRGEVHRRPDARCAIAPAAAATPLTPSTPKKQRAALDMLATEVLLGRQLQLPAGVPAQADGVDVRHRRRTGARSRRRRRSTSSIDQQVLGAAARRARHADESDESRSGCSTTQSRSTSPTQALQAVGALRDAARGDLERAARPARTSRCSGATCSASTRPRVANALRPAAQSMPADARALLRADATKLRAELARRSRRGNCRRKRRRTSRKCAALLDEALKAPLVRQAV